MEQRWYQLFTRKNPPPNAMSSDGNTCEGPSAKMARKWFMEFILIIEYEWLKFTRTYTFVYRFWPNSNIGWYINYKVSRKDHGINGISLQWISSLILHPILRHFSKDKMAIPIFLLWQAVSRALPSSTSLKSWSTHFTQAINAWEMADKLIGVAFRILYREYLQQNRGIYRATTY